MIIDAAWQDVPRQGDVSGVPNLTFIDQSYPVERSLADFQRLRPFRRLAVLLDRDLMQALPRLGPGTAALARAVGADAVIVPSGGDASEILAALPEGIDAVYLTPLPDLSDGELAALLSGLKARRLPTLSWRAVPEVPAGALASWEPAANWQRHARRIAVDLQRIVSGEDAGRLPVRLLSAPRLLLNLSTARAIGFSPSRSVLTDAELTGVDSTGAADTLSLAQAMRVAAAVNLDLAAANLTVASGNQNVRLARSNLLPQAESWLTQTFTREQTASASLGQQSERQLDGGVSFTLPLYVEQARAGYAVERHRQQGREAERDGVLLDVVLEAATNYLNVLRLQTLAEVRRTNLSRTRSNLEIARLREGIGSSGRADVYRWQGEVANARQDLIEAEAQVRTAMLELKRMLNWSFDRPLAQLAAQPGDVALLAQDSTLLEWLDDPVRFTMLSGFLVSEALKASPELMANDAAIAAQQRQETAAARAFWLPDLALQGGFANVFDRGGAGSSVPSSPGSGPDLTWQFRFQLSMPLFNGQKRTAARAQAAIDLERLEVRRQSLRQAVDQRVRSALESAAASYAALALTGEAAQAAGQNYELVSDAYARGAASITGLIDAQTSALNAAESAANAVHEFLLDLLQVERATGAFGSLQQPQQRQAFLDRLNTLKEKL
ncbi:MAG TPA: TolC family protein [Gemmatimonadales bacterium]|nr:TolC family protein [Gemmatimonadales bacterium]